MSKKTYKKDKLIKEVTKSNKKLIEKYSKNFKPVNNKKKPFSGVIEVVNNLDIKKNITAGTLEVSGEVEHLDFKDGVLREVISFPYYSPPIYIPKCSNKPLLDQVKEHICQKKCHTKPSSWLKRKLCSVYQTVKYPVVQLKRLVSYIRSLVCRPKNVN